MPTLSSLPNPWTLNLLLVSWQVFSVTLSGFELYKNAASEFIPVSENQLSPQPPPTFWYNFCPLSTLPPGLTLGKVDTVSVVWSCDVPSCGQGERWACGVSLCHTQFRCWAVGIGGNCRLLGFPGDSWGVLELELGTFSCVVRASGSSVCTWLCSRSVFNWLFAVSRAAWFWEELCPSTPQPERVSCKLHLNT